MKDIKKSLRQFHHYNKKIGALKKNWKHKKTKYLLKLSDFFQKPKNFAQMSWPFWVPINNGEKRKVKLRFTQISKNRSRTKFGQSCFAVYTRVFFDCEVISVFFLYINMVRLVSLFVFVLIGTVLCNHAHESEINGKDTTITTTTSILI